MSTSLENALRDALEEISRQPEFRFLPLEGQRAIERELELLRADASSKLAREPGYRKFALATLWAYVAEHCHSYFGEDACGDVQDHIGTAPR
jgi:hypothetical protein